MLCTPKMGVHIATSSAHSVWCAVHTRAKYNIFKTIFVQLLTDGKLLVCQEKFSSL